WVATDSSSNGTYRDGARVSRFVIDGDVALMLGNPHDGEPIELASVPVPAPRLPVGEAVPPAVVGTPDAARVPDAPRPSGGPGQPIGAFSMLHQTGKRTTIGRHSDNDIVVSDLLASRHHAVLTGRDGRWFIEDLGSYNGTFVNGVRITRRTAVPDGAVISIA